MQTEPLMIEGLAGPVVVNVNSFTGKHSMTVGGQSLTGTRRGDYTLPTADGQTVPARLRSSLLDPHPSIEIAGVRHRTGPVVPLALRILTILPVVLVAGGLIGGVFGALAIGANLAVARGRQSTLVKALIMILTLAVGIAALTAVSIAVN